MGPGFFVAMVTFINKFFIVLHNFFFFFLLFSWPFAQEDQIFLFVD